MASHRRVHSIAGILVASAALAASALAQVPGDARPLARLHGEVFDSLRMAPVPGATVWSETAHRTAVADSLGRFVLDSVPAGRHLVSAAGPHLDALGLQIIREVEVPPDGGHVAVPLATPGLGSMFARLCRTKGEPSAGTGILFGTVRSAGNGNSIAGAAVDVSWLRIPRERGQLPFPVAARLETDSLGAYAVCGVPLDTLLQLNALAGAEGESGVVAMRIPDARLARVDLVVARPGVVGQGAVRGIVVDSTGRAIAGIALILEGAAHETRSASDGTFLLRGLPIGTRTLIVRRPGYTPHYAPLALMPSDTPFVRVEMANVRLLAPVEIRAERRNRLLDEVAQRQLSGSGRHFTAEELSRFATYTALFYSVPTLELWRGRNPSHFALRSRRATSVLGKICHLNIFVDGIKMDIEQLQSYSVDALLAVEVYDRAAQVPLQFRDTANDCGAVLAWTRAGPA